MDPKEIRELIKLISSSNLSSLEFEREGVRLKLVKERAPAITLASPVAAAEFAPAPSPEPVSAAKAEPAAAEAALESGLHVVNSPIVGTFYRAPGPEMPPFVETSGRVKRGQVLCIVEAMKVMNEIECEIDGEVVEVLVADGQPVEYGEPLFHLRPSN